MRLVAWPSSLACLGMSEGDLQLSMPKARRLIGVYDANGSLAGEVSYWVGARLGKTHCALCDITHGTFREKSDFQACRTSFDVPFETFHRNDQPESVRALGLAPVVVAETTDGTIVALLGPAELDALRGSVEAFNEALNAALERHNLLPDA